MSSPVRNHPAPAGKASNRFSLEGRLMRRLTWILSASFLLFSVVYLFILQNDATFHASEEVGELTRDLAAAIDRAPDGTLVFDRNAVARRADWPAGTAYAAIDLHTGLAVRGSDEALLPGLRARGPALLSGEEVMDMPGGMAVLAAERVESHGTTLRIAVLRPMTNAGIAMIGLSHEFAEEILPCFLPVLLLAVVVTWVTIRRNLSPLRRASVEASDVSVDRPGKRMSTDNLSTEIRPVIDAVNRALARLEGALSAQQRFTANAAHELRTPLAVLHARVDGLAPGPVRSALTRDISRMSRAVSQMLLTARLQSRTAGETAALDLALIARDVVADLAPLAQAGGRDIVLEIRSRPVVQGSATGLESAVRNLVENALRFTPMHDLVTVRVGPGPIITVEDHGPGVPDADKARIFEPFWRANAQHCDGAGLGLAIVSEVAALHGGRVVVEDAPGGGARFVLTLLGTAGAKAPSPGKDHDSKVAQPDLAKGPAPARLTSAA